jgi:hypothetical protein
MLVEDEVEDIRRCGLEHSVPPSIEECSWTFILVDVGYCFKHRICCQAGTVEWVHVDLHEFEWCLGSSRLLCEANFLKNILALFIVLVVGF